MQKSGEESTPHFSPITNINAEQLEREQCSEEDPQTQNDDPLQIEYTEPDQKHHYNESSAYENEEKLVEKQYMPKRSDLDCEQSMERNETLTQDNKVQIQRRKNRRNQSAETAQFNTLQRFSNPINSMVESSSDTIFTSMNSPKKNTKLSRSESLTSETQFYDSRKNIQQKFSSSSSQPCFQISTQRIITFSIIYQIFIVFFLTISSIEQQYLWMIVTVVLIFPSYFGVRCIWVASVNEGESLDNSKEITQNDSEFVPERQTKKIHNSYYLENNKQSMEDWRDFQKKRKSKSSKIVPAPNQQISRLSFLSVNEPAPPKKYLITVPYLHNNQLQHIQKCTKCTTSHTNTRIKHCIKCGLCHYGYDHYCVWLGVCVDLRNYWYFMWFVGVLWVIGVTLFTVTLVMSWRWSHNKFIQSQIKKNSYFTLGIWAFTALQNLIGLGFLTYVLVYHIWLNYNGVSTRQHFSGNIINPNNNLLCKSLHHNITDQYPSYFAGSIGKQILESEPSASIIEQSK